MCKLQKISVRATILEFVVLQIVYHQSFGIFGRKLLPEPVLRWVYGPWSFQNFLLSVVCSSLLFNFYLLLFLPPCRSFLFFACSFFNFLCSQLLVNFLSCAWIFPLAPGSFLIELFCAPCSRIITWLVSSPSSVIHYGKFKMKEQVDSFLSEKVSKAMSIYWVFFAQK